MHIIGVFVLLMTSSHSGLLSCMISHNTEEKMIEQYLGMILPESNVHTSQAALAYKADIVKKIEQGNYEEALEMAYNGLKIYPQSFMLQTYFAAIIGDLSEKYAPLIKQKMVGKSKQLFTKLLSGTAAQPKRDMYRFKLSIDAKSAAMRLAIIRIRWRSFFITLTPLPNQYTCSIPLISSAQLFSKYRESVPYE